MKNFLKKYKIIIFLAFIVVVLLFTKVFYKENNQDNTNIKMISNKPTQTIVDNKKDNEDIVKNNIEEKKTTQDKTLNDLEKMTDEELDNYLSQLTEDQFNKLM